MYKVLNKDLKSPYQGFQFRLNQEYHCENFDENPKNECSNGFYATGVEGLIYALRPDRVVYECNCWGKEVRIDQFKHRFEYIKLLREVPSKEVRKLIKDYSDTLDIDYYHAVYPINPFAKKAPEITDKHIDLLRRWASVWDSVWDSVGASVRDSVGASVRDSVWDSVGASVWDSVRDLVGASVRDSVGASVRDSVWDPAWASVWDSAWGPAWASVWAYISSLFPSIKKWGYIEHEEGINPFQPCIDLWHLGIVPSFYGTTWRLHGKQGILFEIKKEDL